MSSQAISRVRATMNAAQKMYGAAQQLHTTADRINRQISSVLFSTELTVVYVCNKISTTNESIDSLDEMLASMAERINKAIDTAILDIQKPIPITTPSSDSAITQRLETAQEYHSQKIASFISAMRMAKENSIVALSTAVSNIQILNSDITPTRIRTVQDSIKQCTEHLFNIQSTVQLASTQLHKIAHHLQHVVAPNICNLYPTMPQCVSRDNSHRR